MIIGLEFKKNIGLPKYTYAQVLCAYLLNKPKGSIKQAIKYTCILTVKQILI